MKYKLYITIPGLPETINQGGRKHWSWKVKEINRWKREVFMRTRGLIPITPLAKAYLSFTRHSSLELDFDNLVNSFKAVQDALVTSGIIINDKPSVVGHPDFKWKRAPRNKGFITIQVEEEL